MDLKTAEDLADDLAAQRQRSSKKVCAKVSSELKELNMLDALLKVEFLSVHRQVSSIDLTLYLNVFKKIGL